MLNPQIKFRYKDYLQLPEQDRRELIGGDFYVVPAPSFRHQHIVANLGLILSGYIRAKAIGEVLWAPFDVVLSEHDVVQPDILYISNERRHIITEANASGAPDLVIEVLSPSTAERDKDLKLSLYARHGVREYWIVDPNENSVDVMELSAEGFEKTTSYSSGAISSSVLPQLAVDLDDVFAE